MTSINLIRRVFRDKNLQINNCLFIVIIYSHSKTHDFKNFFNSLSSIEPMTIFSQFTERKTSESSYLTVIRTKDFEDNVSPANLKSRIKP